MKELIGIIITILIGVIAKWIEDGSKKPKKGKAVPDRGGVSRSYVTTESVPVRSGKTSVPDTVSTPSLTVPFEEGQCAVEHIEEMSDHPVTDDTALADHYDRWRRAIIDTQIITPKFKEY